ncbi:carboxypeptidase-like regulatory domain-containing protein [Thiocapsa sp.]|uniref:carboxypeptidase-like regulatory domain-containing protein n=1 Tax=Thiocapsa sp. TaxID=2024551 RepID=UPI0025E87380|nr:carboxypeptidase-like regulatory domain-containing protein [Thiocapsa sp.]
MRRRDKRFDFAVMLACLGSGTAFAQEPVEQEAQAPTPVAQPTVEWAIAPEGRTLPGGIVLEEGMVLPPGTVLPGGAILPGAPPVAEPSTAPVPATVPVLTPEQVPAPMEASVEEPATAPPPEPPKERRLPGQSTLGVPHISGGIGASEREAMEQVKAQYNLRLLFAVAGSGAYLSNIRVQIQDAAGPTLLGTVTVGPWLYANLAPGDYVLTVEHAGQTQTRNVTLPATGAVAESFYWPAP